MKKFPVFWRNIPTKRKTKWNNFADYITHDGQVYDEALIVYSLQNLKCAVYQVLWVNLISFVGSEWGQWTPQGPCSATCGNGTILRFRECNRPQGEACVGPSQDHLPCNEGHFPRRMNVLSHWSRSVVLNLFSTRPPWSNCSLFQAPPDFK